MSEPVNHYVSYKEVVQMLLGDPCTSYWLRGAINDLENHDPLDAINDLELLTRLMHKRFEEIIDKQKAKGG